MHVINFLEEILAWRMTYMEGLLNARKQWAQRTVVPSLEDKASTEGDEMNMTLAVLFGSGFGRVDLR